MLKKYLDDIGADKVIFGHVGELHFQPSHTNNESKCEDWRC